MTTERRLDEVAAALGRARPRLDEITRARVASRVEAALRDAPLATPEAAPAPRRWRRRALVAGGLLAASAAAAGVIVVTRPAPTGSVVAPVMAALPATIDVAVGESRLLELGDSVITVFGPGRLDGDTTRATARAAAVVVDRARGEEPWALQYEDITVVATRATFAVDRSALVRVTVMRGEVLLLCADGAHPVRAGESAECESKMAAAAPSRRRAPARIAPAPVAPPPVAIAPAPPPRPLRSPAPVVPAAPPAPAAIVVAPAPPPEPAIPVPDEAFRQEPIASAVRPNLYALAEGAMRRGDRNGARAALHAVIAAQPGALDAATALIDLALLAHKDGDDEAARAFLDRLDRHPRRAALTAPAARLRARLAKP